MGCMACTEPQCLYKGALYPFTLVKYEAPLVARMLMMFHVKLLA